MSRIFIELWTERPAWQALDAAARARFMAAVDAAVAPALKGDIACIVAGNLAGAAWAHCAVWQAAHEEHITALRTALHRVGWYHYFDQLDLQGTATTLPQILAGHIGDAG